MENIQINIHDFIESFIKSLEAKDTYTHGHSIRVAHIACDIAKNLDLKEKTIQRIHIAGHLHDIGKIGISDKILNKKSKLNNSEYNELKKHCKIGADFVKNIDILQDVSKIILSHHEWFNGKGYPNQISKNKIPIESRIISVADAFDAMMSHRPYRKPLAFEKVIFELKNNSGKQFDPKIINAFLKILNSKYIKNYYRKNKYFYKRK